MKRISLLACIVIAVLLTLLTSCGERVTPVAYTRFDAPVDMEVVYTSDMYHEQIEVYKDDDLVMTFDFSRCLGYDELEDKWYTLVDVNRTPDMSVSLDSVYEPSYDFYLNGKPLVYTELYPAGDDAVYVFTNIEGFIRTNPNGQINPEKVNVIEYR